MGNILRPRQAALWLACSLSAQAALAVAPDELHQHPEIRFEEHWTSGRIAAYLTEHGIPHTCGHAKGTGIVATISGEGNRCVALRADMDALEIQEETGLPYASTIPERMHACGHDGHSSMLCGAARILWERRAQLAGTVKCIFQPAEEIAAGGRFIVEEGILDDVDAVFAQHCWPGLPCGSVAIGTGPVMASADFFRITVQGKGGHGANPGAAIDPVVVSAHIITALQSIVSREITPGELAIVSCGSIQAGHAPNIIPDQCDLKLSLRSYEPRVRERLCTAVKRIIEAECAASGAPEKPQITHTINAPATYNDEEMVKELQKTFGSYFGDSLVETEPATASEDFSLLATAVGAPYVMWVFGGIDAERWDDAVSRDAVNELPGNHSPFFGPDMKPTLKTAVDAMAVGALTFLGKKCLN